MTEEEYEAIFGPQPNLGVDQHHPDLDGMTGEERETRIDTFLRLAEWHLAGHDDPERYQLLAATAAKRAIRLYRSGLYFDALRSAFAAGSIDSRYSILWGLMEPPRPIGDGKYGEVIRALYIDPPTHTIVLQGEPTDEELDDAFSEFEHFGFEVEEEDLAEAVAAWREGQGYYVLRDETEFHTEGNREVLRLIAVRVPSKD